MLNHSRFDYIVANNNLEGDSDEEALKYHIKIIQLIRIDLQRAMEIYEKLFVKYVIYKIYIYYIVNEKSMIYIYVYYLSVSQNDQFSLYENFVHNVREEAERFVHGYSGGYMREIEENRDRNFGGSGTEPGHYAVRALPRHSEIRRVSEENVICVLPRYKLFFVSYFLNFRNSV